VNIDPTLAWTLGIGAPILLILGWLAGALFIVRSYRLENRNLQILLAHELLKANTKGRRAALIRLLERGAFTVKRRKR